MKNLIKKAAALVICLGILSLALTGCGGGSGASGHVEGTLEEIMQRLYDGAELPDGVQLPMALTNFPLTEDMARGIEYYIGSKGIPFEEGLASESMIGSGAYSVVLLRMQEGADIEVAKQTIRDTVNPAKWICAWVEPDEVVVDSIGDLVIVILWKNYQALHDSFLGLAE